MRVRKNTAAKPEHTDFLGPIPGTEPCQGDVPDDGKPGSGPIPRRRYQLCFISWIRSVRPLRPGGQVRNGLGCLWVSGTAVCRGHVVDLDDGMVDFLAGRRLFHWPWQWR